MNISVHAFDLCQHPDGHYAKQSSKMPYIHPVYHSDHMKMFQNWEKNFTFLFIMLALVLSLA
jgi:hypothetical protein